MQMRHEILYALSVSTRPCKIQVFPLLSHHSHANQISKPVCTGYYVKISDLRTRVLSAAREDDRNVGHVVDASHALLFAMRL